MQDTEFNIHSFKERQLAMKETSEWSLCARQLKQFREQRKRSMEKWGALSHGQSAQFSQCRLNLVFVELERQAREKTVLLSHTRGLSTSKEGSNKQCLAPEIWHPWQPPRAPTAGQTQMSFFLCDRCGYQTPSTPLASPLLRDSCDCLRNSRF